MVQYKTPKEVFALHITLDLDMHDENKIKINVHERCKRDTYAWWRFSLHLCLVLKITATHSNALHLSFTSAVACFQESVGFVRSPTARHLFEELNYFLLYQQHETDAHRHELCTLNNTWNCHRISANTEICPVYKRWIHLFFCFFFCILSASKSNSNYSIIRFYA